MSVSYVHCEKCGIPLHPGIGTVICDNCSRTGKQTEVMDLSKITKHFDKDVLQNMVPTLRDNKQQTANDEIMLEAKFLEMAAKIEMFKDSGLDRPCSDTELEWFNSMDKLKELNSEEILKYQTEIEELKQRIIYKNNVLESDDKQIKKFEQQIENMANIIGKMYSCKNDPDNMEIIWKNYILSDNFKPKDII